MSRMANVGNTRRWLHRTKWLRLIAASSVTLGLPISSQEVQNEFVFGSADARSLLLKVRKAHGLLAPRPLALEGTVVRGDIKSHAAIVIDVARGKYLRSGALIQGEGPSHRLTGKVTHILDGHIYRKIPEASPQIAAVARPRIESEFRKLSVALLVHPPRGRRMVVRTRPAAEFEGEPTYRLHIAADSETVCTLFIRTRDSVVVGWSTMAETSAGVMPQVVVVGATKRVDGMRVPVVIRERTGDQFGSVTTYTRVLVGDAASREFVRLQ